MGKALVCARQLYIFTFSEFLSAAADVLGEATDGRELPDGLHQ